MKREDIEKAARIEREKIHKELQECYKKHKDINLYTAFSATIDRYAIPLFKTGAKWRINSVWHDASEQPRRNTWYIAQIGDSAFDTFTDSANWKSYARSLNIIRWAYIEDLLLNKEE